MLWPHSNKWKVLTSLVRASLQKSFKLALNPNCCWKLVMMFCISPSKIQLNPLKYIHKYKKNNELLKVTYKIVFMALPWFTLISIYLWHGLVAVSMKAITSSAEMVPPYSGEEIPWLELDLWRLRKSCKRYLSYNLFFISK